jgi:hypothetical protein
MIGAVRKAGMSDIAPLLELINGYAAKGIMLPRTRVLWQAGLRRSGAGRTAAQGLEGLPPLPEVSVLR